MIKIVDLFEKVVPLAVHGAMMSFENRKVELVNMEIGRLREATQLINSVMASLNLPAAIEDLSGMCLLQRSKGHWHWAEIKATVGDVIVTFSFYTAVWWRKSSVEINDFLAICVFVEYHCCGTEKSFQRVLFRAENKNTTVVHFVNTFDFR